MTKLPLGIITHSISTGADAIAAGGSSSTIASAKVRS
jgi:hypothetical protein